MNNIQDRANQAITDHRNQVLQTPKYLITLIRALLDEIPAAYEAGAQSVRNELEQEGRNF